MRILPALACLLVPALASAALDPVSLFNAIELDNVRAVESAIAAGDATPDTRIAVPGYGAPGAPLIAVAARAGSLKVVRFLIARRADLDARTSAGESAAMLASFFPEPAGEAIVRELADAGASLENAPGGYTALSYAAYAGNTRVVALLLAKKANPDGAPENGAASVPSPLMMAALNGHRDALRLILRAGADVRQARADGTDARALAVKGNQGHLLPLLDCALGLAPGQSFESACGAL